MRDEAGGQDGVGVAIVTMGKPPDAADFCRRAKVPFVCLSDPARTSYRAFGLRRGSLSDVMGPAVLLPSLRAAAKGHFVGRPVDDVYQLGGLFVIGADGRIGYARYPRNSGDNPSDGTIRRIVAEAQAVRPPTPNPGGV
ncbi:MAG: AhpC/TSA family protein [Dehalococcoidia bacterium]